MRTLYVKIITGYEKEQHYSIPAEEAHKAYYLFLNPNERGIFNNGVAIIGKNIQTIVPDYHQTMGWNSTYELENEDMNQIHSEGIDRKLRDVLFSAKEVARLEPKEKMSLPLSELVPKLLT